MLLQRTIFILKCGKNSQVHSFEWFIFRSSLLLYGQYIKHTSPYIDDGSSWASKQPHHNQINKDKKNAEPREYHNIRPVCSFNHSNASKPIYRIQVYPKQLSQLHLNRAYNRLYEMRKSCESLMSGALTQSEYPNI